MEKHILSILSFCLLCACTSKPDGVNPTVSKQVNESSQNTSSQELNVIPLSKAGQKFPRSGSTARCFNTDCSLLILLPNLPKNNKTGSPFLEVVDWNGMLKHTLRSEAPIHTFALTKDKGRIYVATLSRAQEDDEQDRIVIETLRTDNISGSSTQFKKFAELWHDDVSIINQMVLQARGAQIFLLFENKYIFNFTEAGASKIYTSKSSISTIANHYPEQNEVILAEGKNFKNYKFEAHTSKSYQIHTSNIPSSIVAIDMAKNGKYFVVASKKSLNLYKWGRTRKELHFFPITYTKLDGATSITDVRFVSNDRFLICLSTAIKNKEPETNLVLIEKKGDKFVQSKKWSANAVHIFDSISSSMVLVQGHDNSYRTINISDQSELNSFTPPLYADRISNFAMYDDTLYVALNHGGNNLHRWNVNTADGLSPPHIIPIRGVSDHVESMIINDNIMALSYSKSTNEDYFPFWFLARSDSESIHWKIEKKFKYNDYEKMSEIDLDESGQWAITYSSEPNPSNNIWKRQDKEWLYANFLNKGTKFSFSHSLVKYPFVAWIQYEDGTAGYPSVVIRAIDADSRDDPLFSLKLNLKSEEIFSLDIDMQGDDAKSLKFAVGHKNGFSMYSLLERDWILSTLFSNLNVTLVAFRNNMLLTTFSDGTVRIWKTKKSDDGLIKELKTNSTQFRIDPSHKKSFRIIGTNGQSFEVFDIFSVGEDKVEVRRVG